jgi:poly-D-alanine transfer protein DltD
MDIKKELSLNQTVLLIMDSFGYNNEIIKTVKQLSGQKICYVTLNKTHDSLKEIFKKNKVNMKNIVFIDAISKTIKNVPDQSDSTYFCSSPGALTEISLVISKFLNRNFEYLIFDSLTNLLIYQKKVPVAKFISNLVNKIKAGKIKAIFYALSVKEQDELIKETGMFVDNVVEIKE